MADYMMRSARLGAMRHIGILGLAAAIAGCGQTWNDPYPSADASKDILYSVFVARPKHLDPALSYASDEAVCTQQVCEPPLQYHYLKRPYQLVPLTAAQMPRVSYAEGYSEYEIRIRPGILYQPHPAFARNASGEFLYQSLSPARIAALASPYALPGRGTRELTAEDYIYEIKRLADPRLPSPIYGLMSQHIVGLSDFAARLKKADAALRAEGRGDEWLDLRKYPLSGVERVGAHSFRIRLKGRYPQFAYWLAMPFFAPVPWEVDRFFAQPGMAAKNFTLDWWPA